MTPDTLYNALQTQQNPFSWTRKSNGGFLGVLPAWNLSVVIGVVFSGNPKNPQEGFMASFEEGCATIAVVDITTDTLTVDKVLRLLRTFGSARSEWRNSLTTTMFSSEYGHEIAYATIRPGMLHGRPCLKVCDPNYGTLRIPDCSDMWPLWAFTHYAGMD